MSRVRIGEIEVEGINLNECVNVVMFLLTDERIKEEVKKECLKSKLNNRGYIG